MLETSRLIRRASIGVVVLLVLSACSQADWPSTWADETAEAVCPAGHSRYADSAVLDIEGETVVVIGTTWTDDDADALGATRLSGGDAAPGLDPATGLAPDKVLCLTTRSQPTTDCPDGTTSNEGSTRIEATLHSISLDAELGSTQVLTTQRCRTTDGDVELASTSRGSTRPDAYDVDQVLCDLLTCVLNDDIAAQLSTFRAGDPRAEVCGFNNPFIDGIIELEDGPAYIAHELGYRGALSDAASAIDMATERTICIEASSGSQEISCGEYQLEGQNFGGVVVSQRSVQVNGRWFDGDATEAAASISANLYSECTEEISIVTTTYGSSGVGLTNFDDRTENSTFTSEHLTSIAGDLQQWAAVNAAATDISSADCNAISGLQSLEDLQRRLDGYDDGLERWSIDPPEGLQRDVDALQSRTSDLFDAIDDDSALFDPIFELWYVAHFNWPLINTWADLSDEDATDDDFALALMGMPARVGLVSIAEPAFATRHETVDQLQRLYADHC